MIQKRAIELVRVSTEEQAGDDRASLPAQRSANRQTAERYGLSIIRSIEFWDVSGTSVLLSPEIQEMLRLMESADIHGVIAREFSRLMRPENYADFALLQAFVDTRTLLYLPEGPIDFASKSGRLLGTMQAAWAGVQRVEFLEQTWKAKEEMRRQGKHAHGRNSLPFGVAYDRSSGWSYLPEAERVKEAFRLVLSGDASYRSVSEKVGINENTLKDMLRNPIYMGWRVIDKKRDPSPSAKRVGPAGRQGDRRKIKRAESEIIRVRVFDEPLISEETFRTVQDILELKRRAHWKLKPGRDITYNGLLFCTCGRICHAKKVRCGYYRCAGRAQGCEAPYMRRDRLDPALDRLFSDRGFLQEVARELIKRRERPEAGRAERLTEEYDSLTVRRERILDAYYAGHTTAEARDVKLKEVVERMRVVGKLLDAERPVAGVDPRSLAKVFRPFRRFARLAREDRRRLLLALAPEIRVYDYRVESLGIKWGTSVQRPLL